MPWCLFIIKHRDNNEEYVTSAGISERVGELSAFSVTILVHGVCQLVTLGLHVTKGLSIEEDFFNAIKYSSLMASFALHLTGQLVTEETSTILHL